jgi:hypothetical protein
MLPKCDAAPVMTKARPVPGTHVILLGLPKGFVDDLPNEDRKALCGAVGKPVLLESYDEDGRAILTFWASRYKCHTILVDAALIEPPSKD